MTRRVIWVLGLAYVLSAALSCPAASATATPSPGWSISSTAEPTHLSAGDLQEGRAEDDYALTVTNAGSRASEGEVTITDSLPADVVPVEASVEEPDQNKSGECETTTPIVCRYSRPVPAGGELLAIIRVAVISAAPSIPLTNTASVTGGGGSEVTTSESTIANVGPVPFGISKFSFEAGDLDGGPDTQAADHPYAVTTRIALNTDNLHSLRARSYATVAKEVENIAVDLPLGFVGDPLAAERCPAIDLTDFTGSGENERATCPAGSIIGTFRYVKEGGDRSRRFPIFNLIPANGYPAEFGINAELSQPVFLYANVIPSASGYRLQVAAPGILRAVGIEESAVTIFGDPGEYNGTGDSGAFLANPVNCSSGPLSASAEATAWEGGLGSAETVAYPSVTGCELLGGAAAFDPSIEVKPEETQADTPSGYEVDLKVPQAPEVFGQLATPDLKNATVTLPAGVSVSPSAASGPDALEGCTEAQIDLLGTELGEGHPGGNGNPYDDGLTHASPGQCPEGSRIGEVEVKTPLLQEALHGHVYLAQPRCGGSGQSECTEEAAEKGEVFGLYLEITSKPVREGGSGVIIKLAGSVEVGGYGAHNGLAPGQLRAKFDNNPQLPFEDLKMVFSGGQRAALANPQSCGTFTTTSELEPWSAPGSGPNATPSSAFAVTGCANPMPFSPSFSAGAVQTLAGGFSPFTLRLTRQDGEQDFAGVSLTTPAGLEGIVSKVALCSEPQAAQGTCSESSRIGTATVASGAGTSPLWVSGPVYITEAYKGAPFGLSIVVPAKAGPFNLGNVVVRSAISVNPSTAQLTVTSDPLPQSVDGVPFRLKTINVEVNRPEFMFNPTNCESQSIGGTIAGAQGASSAVSSPFAVTGCKDLPFDPSFTVSTSGRTSKADGADLSVTVAQKPGEANIHRVDLQLPLQLPSRLTTLQKACKEAQFNANPAGCPEGSVIGTATAHTPVLQAPLTGPAYLVSHGGEAFPDVEFVLQADERGGDIEIVLDGKTQIKKGITYSRFETVPDAPISSFETTLPEGPHSVLTANGNLCKPTKTVTVKKRVAVRRKGHTVHVLRSVAERVAAPLVMPTTIVGQNGAVLTQSTKINVTVCPKATKARKRAKKASRARRKR